MNLCSPLLLLNMPDPQWHQYKYHNCYQLSSSLDWSATLPALLMNGYASDVDEFHNHRIFKTCHLYYLYMGNKINYATVSQFPDFTYCWQQAYLRHSQLIDSKQVLLNFCFQLSSFLKTTIGLIMDRKWQYRCR
jgi:hypothetical protein